MELKEKKSIMRFSLRDINLAKTVAAVYRWGKIPVFLFKGVLCVLWRFTMKRGQA